MKANKSKVGSDISSNEEHGGQCQGEHHDITICKSSTAWLLPCSGQFSTLKTSSPSISSFKYVIINNDVIILIMVIIFYLFHLTQVGPIEISFQRETWPRQQQHNHNATI